MILSLSKLKTQFKSPLRVVAGFLYRSRENRGRKCRELTQQKAQLQRELEKCREEKQQHLEKIRELQREKFQLQEELRLAEQTTCRLPPDPPLKNHHFGPRKISLAVNLARKVGLRASAEAMQIFFDFLGVEEKVPDWTSIRLWMQRLGLAAMQEPLEPADDYVWFVDHSIQIGKEKILVVLAIRASQMPPPGETIKHEDVRLLMVRPGTSWTKEEVAKECEELAKVRGKPHSVVIDGASELREGLAALNTPPDSPSAGALEASDFPEGAEALNPQPASPVESDDLPQNAETLNVQEINAMDLSDSSDGVERLNPQPANAVACNSLADEANVSTTEPATEPATEPTAEPATEPTTEPTAEPTAEPATEPAETIIIQDFKHQAANEMKKLIGNDERFQEFSGQAGKTRSAVQQTELGHLTPPSPKQKSRFMNLAATLHWAMAMLWLLNHPNAKARQGLDADRFEAKFGWLRGFENDLLVWSHCQKIVSTCLTYINQHGIFRGAAKQLRQLIVTEDMPATCRLLSARLLRFVRHMEARLQPGERLPFSTEILESCFGLYKQLQRQHSKGGFTSLLPAFGVLLQPLTPSTVETLLPQAPVKSVEAWLKENLPQTLASKRRRMYNEFKEEATESATDCYTAI